MANPKVKKKNIPEKVQKTTWKCSAGRNSPSTKV